MSSAPVLPAWTATCVAVEPAAHVFIDIAFVLWPSFYYGPRNGFSAEQWEALREPLYQPPIAMHEQAPGLVLSADCIGHEEALCAHYRDVIEKAARHRQPLEDSAHFWNRPVIHSPGRFLLSFPWHDRFLDGRVFLDAIATAAPGEVFSDLEQGWELEIHLDRQDTLYLHDGNPDAQECHLWLKFPREPLRQQAKAVRARAAGLIALMATELGRDYWS
jgi:hypothetical protein